MMRLYLVLESRAFHVVAESEELALQAAKRVPNRDDIPASFLAEEVTVDVIEGKCSVDLGCDLAHAVNEEDSPDLPYGWDWRPGQGRQSTLQEIVADMIETKEAELQAEHDARAKGVLFPGVEPKPLPVEEEPES